MVSFEILSVFAAITSAFDRESIVYHFKVKGGRTGIMRLFLLIITIIKEGVEFLHTRKIIITN